MPITKRTTRFERVIVRHYYVEKDKRIITKQSIVELPFRDDKVWCEKEWRDVDHIDPEARGGLLYEVYIKDT
jgi:hypothetical protein